MFFLILAAAVAVAIWSLVIGKRAGFFSAKTFTFALPGVALLIVGSVFSYDFFHIASGPIPITLDRLLLVALCGIFGALVLRRRTVIKLPDTTDWLVVAILAALLLSALMTDWTFKGNRPISRWLFFYMMPATLYFLIRQTRIRDVELKWISIVFVLFGIYLALTAVAESRGWYSLVFPTYIRNEELIEFLGRGRGPFMNPVSNGIYITVCLGAAMLLFWHSRSTMKLAALAALPILAIGVLATLTRSVWLGMGIGAGLIAWLPAKRRQRGYLLVVAALVGVIGLISLGDKLVQFKRDKHVTLNQMSESAQLRPIFIVVAVEMFQDHPFRGCGFGQYARARMKYVNQANTGYEMRKAKDYLQHNVFLSFLTETGLIGFSLLVLLLLKATQVSLMLFKNPNASSWARGYALLLICLLTSYCINGMFHDVSIVPMANMLLFFILAIVANQQAAFAPTVAGLPVTTTTVNTESSKRLFGYN